MQVSNRSAARTLTQQASTEDAGHHTSRPLGRILKYSAGGLGILSLGSAGVGLRYARWLERPPHGYDPMSGAVMGMLAGGAAFVLAGGLGALAAGTFGVGLLTD